MPAPNEKASKRSCQFLSIMVFVVLPFSLILLGLLLWWGRESSGNRRLAARKATITKQGLPIDDASMDRFYKDRTDPTNTAAWQGILATMASEDFKSSLDGVAILLVASEEPILPGHEWKEEAASVAFLEKWKTLHADAVQLSIDAKPVRFPTVFDSFNTPLTEIQNLREVARLLELKGRVGLRSSDSAVVRENVDALMGLSRVPTGYPFLVSQLVSIAMDGIGVGLLKDAIEYDVLNEADLQVLLPKVLAAANVGNDWRETVAGERGMALPVFTDSRKASSVGLPSIPGRSHDALLYLDLTDGVMDAPVENLVEFKAKLQSVEARVQEIANANLLSKFDSIMTLQTLPAMGACGEAFIRRALQHRIAAIAMGLRLYEDRRTSLPNSLDALAEIPLDIIRLSPTDKTPFGYRTVDGNAKLWGGSHKNTLLIANEPHAVQSEGEDNLAKSNRELWLWELPAGKK
jgi:hypothetical protein